jgi:hypothetical protein
MVVEWGILAMPMPSRWSYIMRNRIPILAYLLLPALLLITVLGCRQAASSHDALVAASWNNAAKAQLLKVWGEPSAITSTMRHKNRVETLSYFAVTGKSYPSLDGTTTFTMTDKDAPRNFDFTVDNNDKIVKGTVIYPRASAASHT